MMQAPKIFMLSDAQRQPDWRTALTAQPRHIGLILRDYEHDARLQLAAEMAALCAAKKGAPLPLPVIVAWPYLWVPPFIVRLLCCTVPSCAAGRGGPATARPCIIWPSFWRRSRPVSAASLLRRSLPQKAIKTRDRFRYGAPCHYCARRDKAVCALMRWAA